MAKRSTRLFRDGRSYNGYHDTPVTREQMNAIWELMKWGSNLGQSAARAPGVVR